MACLIQSEQLQIHLGVCVRIVYVPRFLLLHQLPYRISAESKPVVMNPVFFDQAQKMATFLLVSYCSGSSKYTSGHTTFSPSLI